MKSNLDNEIEILKSRTLVESTVRKLNLNITWSAPGKYQIRDLRDAPISVNFMDKTNGFIKVLLTWILPNWHPQLWIS
jgi:uncharacterized protein involved in exopolysaccharide biosynthesis